MDGFVLYYILYQNNTSDGVVMVCAPAAAVLFVSHSCLGHSCCTWQRTMMGPSWDMYWLKCMYDDDDDVVVVLG